MKKRIEWSYIIVCCALVLLSKVYKLAEIPYGLHVDEAGMGYDAWCLANYGVDRWLNHNPVYLVNFGGGQSALYAYLCAALIKIFGNGSVNVLLMRLPAVIISFVAYLAALVMLWKVFGKYWMMIGAFLLGIMPYFFMQSRFGLDCNLLVNMLTISVCLFQVALERRKSVLFVLAGLAWGLTYYTYALSYVPNTIILIVLVAYVLWLNRELWKKMILFLMPVIMLGLPLALVILINHFELPQINFPFMSIIRIPAYRGGEISFTVETILENLYMIVKCILLRDGIEYNGFAGYYTMYLISVPFILLGFVLMGSFCLKTLSKREYHLSQVWWLIFVVYFFSSLGVSALNINKLNGMFFAVFFFLMWGIRAVYSFLQGYKKNVACVAMGLLLCVYAKDAFSFFNFYFRMYPEVIYPQFLFLGTYENTLKHLEEEGLAEKTIYVHAGNIYYCLSEMCNPYDFNAPETGEVFYENFVFALPEGYEPGAVYIVRETDEEFRESIEKHLSLKFSDGMYVCYY